MKRHHGRKPLVPDARDWRVDRLKKLLDAGLVVPVSWTSPRMLDQGLSPHCVGFGTGGLLNADDEYHGSPDLHNDDCHDLYYEVKEFEGEPGKENGAYVRSGIVISMRKGWVSNYAFLMNVDEIWDWLAYHGPVLMGTDWTTDMTEPAAGGFVSVNGAYEGGHCWWLQGVLSDDIAACVNSWGEGWGIKGYFYIHKADLARLMAGLRYPGEAWAVTGPLPPAPHPEPDPEPEPQPQPEPEPEARASLIDLIISILRWVLDIFKSTG